MLTHFGRLQLFWKLVFGLMRSIIAIEQQQRAAIICYYIIAPLFEIVDGRQPSRADEHLYSWKPFPSHTIYLLPEFRHISSPDVDFSHNPGVWLPSSVSTQPRRRLALISAQEKSAEETLKHRQEIQRQARNHW